MQRFVGSFTNKIDKKGRVSVPASFRACLAQSRFAGFIGVPSFEFEAVEALTEERFDAIVEEIDMLDPFGEDRQDLMDAFAGDSHRVAFDSEGRMGLPAALLEFAGIGEEVRFVGAGTHFQIWNPEVHDARRAEVRQRIREKKLTLPGWRGGARNQGQGGEQ